MWGGGIICIIEMVGIIEGVGIIAMVGIIEVRPPKIGSRFFLQPVSGVQVSVRPPKIGSRILFTTGLRCSGVG